MFFRPEELSPVELIKSCLQIVFVLVPILVDLVEFLKNSS